MVHRQPGGFTLVEVLIVVLCAGIAAAVAIPSVGALVREQRVETASAELAAALRYAQSEAIRGARQVGVEICVRQTPSGLNGFDDGNWFRVYDAGDASEPTMVSPRTGREFLTDLDQGPATGDVAITFVRSGGGRQLVFDAYGEPLQTDGRFDLVSGDQQRRVTVLAVTGRVTVNTP